MSDLIRTIGWGLYCASSWTWCIGMFLPIIMLDRYGWPGLLVFAAPNVLGCAALGYVLTRDASLGMVRRHLAAMRWFSVVTIAYHMFFIPFLAMRWTLPLPGLDASLPTPDWIGPALALGIFGVGLALSRAPQRAWPWLGAGAWLMSLGAFLWFGVDELGARTWPTHGGEALLWLAPTVIFGFLLCPYLDLTFHRARQAAPSRHAFGIFGATFAVMLLFTAAYAGVISLPGVVFTHLLVQSTFTVGAHLRELRATGDEHAAPAVSPTALALLAVLAIPVVFIARVFDDPGRAGIDLYLRMLVFYGLVFPAYVLLFIGPWRRLRRRRHTYARFAMIILVCAPVYELGFIHGTTWLLAGPLAFLLLYATYGGLNRERAAESSSTGGPAAPHA
ncbi:MAG: hypothetical protein KDA25_02450 [Phycisphaerales bacterium]|nr:hypothetical protein [Phycisphaerales bacterium]